MENLQKLFTEEQVNNVAEKILAATKDKFFEQLNQSFYKETSDYLYEHYNNFQSGLKNDLIKEITEQFVSDPSNYQFRELRNKLFKENKDEIVTALTDQAIYETLETIILNYSHKDATFSWRWNEGLVNFLLTNFDKFKDNERFNSPLLKEIERLKYTINNMQSKINSLYSQINDLICKE